MDKLVDYLVSYGVLKTPAIIKAFLSVNRRDFVLPEYESLVYEDIPLPIGYGQTISQPSVVAFMLELLQPQENEKILDVGSGSGWTTALLAQIVGPKGEIKGVEIIPELTEYGSRNLDKYGYENAQILQANEKELGLKTYAPYDRILVSASAEELPELLLEQVKKKGTIVLPVRNSILKIDKMNGLKTEDHPGFLFVPLV